MFVVMVLEAGANAAFNFTQLTVLEYCIPAFFTKTQEADLRQLTAFIDKIN